MASSPVRAVEIVEVAPRDGLQNEKALVSSAVKVELVQRAVAAGARRIEVTSFVHPQRVPQMADAEKVLGALGEIPGVELSALALNARGYDRAFAAGVRSVNTVVVTTETFSERNQGMSVAETLAVVAALRDRAAADGVRFAVTLAATFGCPFEGEVSDETFAAVASQVAALAPDEVALADTIGVAVPTDVERRIAAMRTIAPDAVLRLHLHDTRNTAIANAVAGVRAGVAVLDSSLAGVGGCPFAPAATGNVATEDVVYALERMGIATGIDIDDAIETARWLAGQLGISPPGMVARAGAFPARPSVDD